VRGPLADAHLARAEEAEERGHRVTAVEALRAAAADLLFAQMAFNFDNERKRELYARSSATVARAGALAGWGRVQLPFENGYLVGWIVRPSGPVRGTVIVFGGQSGWGAAYLRLADAPTARGLATFLVEGPGQGEPRMESGLLLDGDTCTVPTPRSSTTCRRSRTWPVRSGCGATAWGSLRRNHRRLGPAGDGGVRQRRPGAAPAARHADLRRAGRRDARLGRPGRGAAQLRPARPATLRVWDDGEHVITNHAEERNAVVADWFCEQWS
jgi:hypothetical protein